MSNDFIAATTSAATKLYEANKEAYVLVWNASVENGEKTVKLAKGYLDEAAVKPEDFGDTTLLDQLLAQAKKSQEAGQELVQSYFAASLASLYFPFAVADQVLRPPAR